MKFTSFLLLFIIQISFQVSGQKKINPEELLKNKGQQSDSTLFHNYKAIHNYFIDYHPDSSIFYDKQAIEYFEESDNIPLLINMYESIAVAYIRIGDYGNALINATMGLELAEEINHIEFQANICNSMGIIFATNKDYEKAKEYYSRAIELHEELKDFLRVGIILTNLTGIHIEEGNPEEAKKCAIQALDIYIEYADTLLQSVALNNLGEVYLDINEIDSALTYLHQAEQLKNDLGLRNRLPVTLNHLAEAYMKKGQKEPALNYFQEALRIGDSIGMPAERIETLFGLYDYYKTTGNYEKALVNLEFYHNTKDSLFNIRKDRQIKELEIRYQVDKKNSEIELLNSKVVLQRSLRNLGILLLLVVAALFIVTYNRIRLKSRLLEKENDLEKEKSKQLKYELEENNRKLMAQSMLSIQKNQLLNEIKEKLTTIEGPCENINQAVKLVEETHSADKEWEDLKIHFTRVHPDFFSRLQEACPDLTSNDLRHCAYIKIQMSTKDVARIMNVDPKSVKMTRYRLKKKLSLAEEDSLENFLINL